MPVFDFPGAIGSYDRIIGNNVNFVGILVTDEVRKNGADNGSHATGNDDDGYILCLAPGVKVFESYV